MPRKKKEAPEVQAEETKKPRRTRKKAAPEAPAVEEVKTAAEQPAEEAAVQEKAEEAAVQAEPAASETTPAPAEEKKPAKRVRKTKEAAAPAKAVKAPAEKKAPAKRGKKKAAAAAEAKPAEAVMPTPEETKPAPEPAKKKAVKPRKGRKPEVRIQSVMGGELLIEEIVKRVVEAAETEDVQIWIKPEENKAYFTIAGKDNVGGYVVLWEE